MNSASDIPNAVFVLSQIPDNTRDRTSGLGHGEAVGRKGPRGGNLDDPQFHPERRNSALNAQPNETGLPGLHRFEDATVPGLKNEQPWHRMAAFMLLVGRTNSEIGMAAGKTPAEVSFLRAQRWFQELLATLANEAGQDLQAAITTHAHDAINRLAEFAQGDIKELGARNVLSACLAIVDHAKGKPTQTILSSVTHNTMQPAEEMADIHQQLAALRSSAAREEPKTVVLLP